MADESRDGIYQYESGLTTLEARSWRGYFSIELDSPWAGDTQTGFGEMISMDVPWDEAVKLAKFILEHAPSNHLNEIRDLGEFVAERKGKE